MGKNNLSGAWGEALAAKYLMKKRYKLVATNFKSRFGEIDLIMENKKFLVLKLFDLKLFQCFRQN